MASKRDPGAFMCYEAALPDEPIFTLLGRDPAAPATLRFWADERLRRDKGVTPEDIDRIQTARNDSAAFIAWRLANLDPLGDGVPTWRLPRQIETDEDAISMQPETVYVPAEHNGDEAIRLSKEWLGRITNDLVEGRIDRLAFADLIALAFTSPLDYMKREDAEFLKTDDPNNKDCQSARVAPALIPIITSLRDLTAGMIRYANKEDRPYTADELGLALEAMEQYADRITEQCAELEMLTDRPIGKSPVLGAPYGRSQPSHARPPVLDEKPDDLAHSPEIPPHRFSMFHKGEQYAYARGLEINPSHLPIALDEMAKDGWHLVSIFGATDSKNVGFIFHRQPPSALEYIHGYGWPRPETVTSEKLDRWLAGEPLATIMYEPDESDPFIAPTDDDGDGPCGMGRGLEP